MLERPERQRREAQLDDERAPRPRVNARERTIRAYSAYLELRDAAACMHNELASQLRVLDLTMMEYRVLDTLWREPQYLEKISMLLDIQKQNVAKTIQRLWESGWVRRRRRRLAPCYDRWNAVIERGVRPNGSKPRGRLVNQIELTEYGREQFKRIRPLHLKLVKAWMSVLDQREQLTLTRFCMKLRRGNIVKFALEARWWDRDENWAEVVRQR